MRRRRFLINIVFCMFWVFCNETNSQTVNEWYQSAIKKRSEHDFKQADSLFKLVFKKQKRQLPQDICYHYGVVLFQLGERKQSEQFFLKYLKLAPKNQAFKDSSVYYLGLMEHKLQEPTKTISIVLDTCDVCRGKGKRMEPCKKCKASGKVRCFMCQGNGVIPQKTEIGNQKFSTCNHCSGKGMLLCDLCKGSKEVFDVCNKCKGVGKISRRE